jgi:hypothetical protein
MGMKKQILFAIIGGAVGVGLGLLLRNYGSS